MATEASRRIHVLELRSVRGTGGGPEKTILLGAERRDHARFDVTVCYIRDNRDQIFGIDQRANATTIDYVEVREKHSFDPGIWRDLRRLVRDRGVQIIHAHEYKTDLLALLLAKRTGAVPLATVHGWTGQTSREIRFYYPVDKWLLRYFPRIIAVSSEIKEELVRRGARAERITVLLNAIDPDAFKRRGTGAEMRTRFGLPEHAVIIGAVGRLEPQKRFDLLLEAVAPLVSTRPDVHVVIAGDGSLRADLDNQLKRLNLDGRVHLVGHQADIAGLQEMFAVYVQSSEYEGTPNSVLEAMAMGTPLVATDVGGTRELAWPDLHGLIVPRHDVLALRGAIVETLDNMTAAHRRADAARGRIETDLSFEARTRSLEGIYAEMATGH